MEIQTQIDIDAPPEQVWAVLTDFERHPAWNPFIREIQGEVLEGARLRVRLGPPGRKPMTFRPVVTRAERASTFAWLGALLAPWVFSGEHRFRLEPLDGGGDPVLPRSGVRGCAGPVATEEPGDGHAAGVRADERVLESRGGEALSQPA